MFKAVENFEQIAKRAAQCRECHRCFALSDGILICGFQVAFSEHFAFLVNTPS